MKRKRGTKGKQAEIANQEPKHLPTENGETKNEESSASDEAEKKKSSLINFMYHVFYILLHWSLSPFFYNPEEYFYQLFCKCKFFSCSRNIFKKEGIPPHPIF